MKSNKKNIIDFLENKRLNKIEILLKIIEHLRDPEDGCEWDKKQTFSSIAPYTIEESYEVVQAIQEENFEELKEELGDLLLQVVFLSQLANEKKLFSFDDVVFTIKEKLIRRHPHIFKEKNSSNNIKTAEEVKNQWDEIKLDEKKKKGLEFNNSPLNRVTRVLPSIIKSQKIQEEVSKDGFDFNDIDGCIDKLLEELDEFKEALKSQNEFNLIDEGGDLLFSAINILRKSGINSDEALNHANIKFIKRYSKAEELASLDGFNFEKLSIMEKEKYWLKSKKFHN